MVPADVALNHSQLFFTRVLPPSARVLEVGCGNGQLAWRLAHLGHSVVGLDILLPADRPSHPGLRFEQSDFYQYKDEPFDAVLFTSSLHHLHPLDKAIRRARNLVKPSGLVVVDDFDLLAPDVATLRWHYEAQALLTHAGVVATRESAHSHEGHARPQHPPNEQPLVRWQEEHVYAPPLHSGEAMLHALRAAGELLEVARVPYLFRYFASLLATAPRDVNVTEWMLATEERRIAAGSLKAVGLRAVCRVG